MEYICFSPQITLLIKGAFSEVITLNGANIGSVIGKTKSFNYHLHLTESKSCWCWFNFNER